MVERVGAFFDVDGTLLKGNVIRYYAFLRRREMGMIWRQIWSAGLLLRVPYYLIVDRISRELLTTRFYKNYRTFTPLRLRDGASALFHEELKPNLYPRALECIKAHRAKGHIVVLVSGSICQIVTPVAEHLGVDGILCTKLEVVRGAFTGALKGGGDSVIVTGDKASEATSQLNSSVDDGLVNITRNENSGELGYTRTAEGPLTEGTQQLLDAIDDPSIQVNMNASDNKITTKGNLFIGGAFMGNSVTTVPGPGNFNNLVTSYQEINTSVLGAADAYNGTPGSLTLHEATESYEGARISQKSGVSAGAAGSAEVLNPSSVYSRAHNAASPQNMNISENIIRDSRGTPYRVEYSVQKAGAAPKIIMTYPD